MYHTWRKDLLSRKGEVMDMWVFGLVHTCSCEYDQINEEGIFDHLRVLQTHAQIISLCSVFVCVCVCVGGGSSISWDHFLTIAEYVDVSL